MTYNNFTRIVLICLFISHQFVFAQAPAKSFSEKLDGIKTSSKELTKNASTDASSIGQSGTMSTSIPITEVSSRTMSFPLQLQYSSGITVDQTSGPVGLGWALPVGSIVRDFGSFEPDYTSTLHEADMKNSVEALNLPPHAAKGWMETMNGSSINPYSHKQYLGQDAIERKAGRDIPLSDIYHVNVQGFLSNAFWNSGQIGRQQSHVWKWTDFQNWKISHDVKTYRISQEFSNINEATLTGNYYAADKSRFNISSIPAAAIGVLPYVKNGYFRQPSSHNPSLEESWVEYEDFKSFTITDDSGKKYVFGRGLRGQKYVFSDDPYWSSHASPTANAANGNFWKIDYIAEWLLTEILSVDYVDLNGNGMADDGDAGDWIRFEYTPPTKGEYTVLVSTNPLVSRMGQEVPTHRQWSNFSQTDQASSLMREIAYLKKIVTPTQYIDLTISKRYDVEHDYFDKPANRVGNYFYYENRKYSSNGMSGTDADFDVRYPVETMKYDTIRIFSKLINQNLYPAQNNSLGMVVLNYAQKGSAQELAVSEYLIRTNEELTKGLGSPSSGFSIESYKDNVNKRGKTTLLSVDFFGSNLLASDKSSYKLEYAYNPNYDEIHKREIVRKFYLPSLRQGSNPQANPNGFNRADTPFSYAQKKLQSNGIDYLTSSPTVISPYDFLINFPYQEKYYRFNTTDLNIAVFCLSYQNSGDFSHSYPLAVSNEPHPLLPVEDVFGYLYSEGCTKCPSAWSLTKITYPTGGEVSFEYEQGNYLVGTDNPNWNIRANEIPVIKEYNNLAKKRSYIQDAYNRYYTNTFPKKLTASYEVALPNTFGIRLKSKTINDRVNPPVVISYTYENGHFTSLPSAYLQRYLSGFNQFAIRENSRHSVETDKYISSGLMGLDAEFITDYASKMKFSVISNIALDDYESTHFYENILEKYADNSFVKTHYGPITGTASVVYAQNHLLCTRLPGGSWDGRYTLAGNNLTLTPIGILSSGKYQSGGLSPYSLETYTYERSAIGTVKSLSVDYTIGTSSPNTIALWNNSFEVWFPYTSGGVTLFAWIANTVQDQMYLPYNGVPVYSFEKWGTFKTVIKKKENSYKGMVSKIEYTYDPSTFILKEEKKETNYNTEKYITTYQYAHETYSGQTSKFTALNLLNLPTRTTNYLNTVSNANAISAQMITYNLTPAIPKFLHDYQYETDAVNHTTGTFTLVPFNILTSSNPQWRMVEADGISYNKAGSMVSSRTARLYNQSTSGYDMNASKASFSYPDRAFDATYTGFEDLHGRHLINENWNSESYLDEKWFADEFNTTETPAAAVFTSADPCGNSYSYLIQSYPMKKLISVNSITSLPVGEAVEVKLTLTNSSVITFNSEVAAIYPETVLPASSQAMSMNYVVCFTSPVSFPNNDPLLQQIASVTVHTKRPVYNLSKTYARTGNYSYQLADRVFTTTTQKTPVRPVRITHFINEDLACMVPQGVPEPTSAARNITVPETCYWDYEASVWLKYDLNLPSVPVEYTSTPKSSDAAADAIYRRGEVQETPSSTDVKIIYKIWNHNRTTLIETKTFYVSSISGAWTQYTIPIPIYKGSQKWVDVYVENAKINQLRPSRSVFADDILVYPKGAKYNYAGLDPFANTTYSVNNDDVFIQTVFDAKGREIKHKNEYNKVVSEQEYYDHPNWNSANNVITQRNWVSSGVFNETLDYLDGFGKLKQTMVSDPVRNIRMVRSTNIYNNKGLLEKSFKAYALKGAATTNKHDGTYAAKTAALYGSNYAFTEVVYEPVPEEKIQAMNAPRENTETPVVVSQTDYVSTTAITHPYATPAIVYPAGQLLVHEFTDAMGYKTKTFMDNLGKVMMEEHEIGYTYGQLANGTIQQATSGPYAYSRTWFLYDATGRLTKVHDPEGKVNEYYYNSLGLVVKSITADKGISEMRYDKYGQVRFVRNSKDAAAVTSSIYGADQFKYLKYDVWGRMTESGFYMAPPNTPGIIVPIPIIVFNNYSIINNQDFPTANQSLVQLHEKMLYDGTRDQFNSNSLLEHRIYSQHTANSYLIYQPQKTDKTTYKYMADGQLARVEYNYQDLPGTHAFQPMYNDMRIVTGKQYDHPVGSFYDITWYSLLDNLGRVTENAVTHNTITKQIGKNYYDMTGNQIMHGLGATGNSASPHLDYLYVRKDIRDQTVNSMGKTFRLGLKYNKAGNISDQYWSSEHFDPTVNPNSVHINQYAYTYDRMHRLIGADYKESTQANNPFSYFDTLAATFPGDFTCTLFEEWPIYFEGVYSLLTESIDNNIFVELAQKSINTIGILQTMYMNNNVEFQSMNKNEQDAFIKSYIKKSQSKGEEPFAFELLMAEVEGNTNHINLIMNSGGPDPGYLIYTKDLLLRGPFNASNCKPNPNSTVYGLLPKFTFPETVNNVTKYDAAYWYMTNGNLTTLNRTDNVGERRSQGYSYGNNANNRLTEVEFEDNTGITAHAYTYDLTGNLLTDPRNGITAITYSGYNDLPSSITNTSGQKKYRYNGEKQRSVKEISNNDKEFYLEGVILDQTGRVKSYQTDNGYAVPNISNQTISYFYYVKDWLGTTRSVINENGETENATDHYPYGMRMPGRSFVTDAEGNRYQFTGHEHDGETNYDYHGARYYNSELCRYMNVDPVIKYHESPYVYAADNPICFIDVNGEDTLHVQRHEVEVDLGNGKKGTVTETHTDKISYAGDDLIVYYFLYDKNGNLTTSYGRRGFEPGSPESEAYTKPREYYNEKGVKVLDEKTKKPSLKPQWELATISREYNPHNEVAEDYWNALQNGNSTRILFAMHLSVNVDFKPPAQTGWDEQINRGKVENALAAMAQRTIAKMNEKHALGEIHIIGYHSFHTGSDGQGGQGISDEDNDALARKRKESTLGYMQKTYAKSGFTYIPSHKGINDYPYRRAIVYTKLGTDAGAERRKNAGRLQQR